jgi:hypothetical protein
MEIEQVICLGLSLAFLSSGPGIGCSAAPRVADLQGRADGSEISGCAFHESGFGAPDFSCTARRHGPYGRRAALGDSQQCRPSYWLEKALGAMALDFVVVIQHVLHQAICPVAVAHRAAQTWILI